MPFYCKISLPGDVIDVNCEGPYEFLERWGQDGSEWAVDLESALSKVYKHCASEAHRDVSRGHRGSDRFVLSLKSPSGPAFSLSFHQSTHPRPLTVVVSCSLSALSVAPPPRAFLRRSSHLPISGWFARVGRVDAPTSTGEGGGCLGTTHTLRRE